MLNKNVTKIWDSVSDGKYLWIFQSLRLLMSKFSDPIKFVFSCLLHSPYALLFLFNLLFHY